MSKQLIMNGGAGSTSSSSFRSTTAMTNHLSMRTAQMTSALRLIQAFHDPNTRERALLLLSKDRAIHEHLAPLLWHSRGTIFALLQEITSAYVSLYSPNFTNQKSTRVCNALSLLQCVAAHPHTKILFLKANIQFYLYPFLNNTSTARLQQYLRLSSLGVIGALVKVDDTQVITLLLESQIFPSCLVSMEVGDDLSKIVATFIVYRILLNKEGLKYCCVLAERFFAVAGVLRNMVEKLAEDRNISGDSCKQILKHIIQCYHRLSENSRACEALKCLIPPKLRDATFIGVLCDDETAAECLRPLFYNVNAKHGYRGQPAKQSLGNSSRGA